MASGKSIGPTVIFIRHAEGEHNATRRSDIHDPPITVPTGVTQCRDLSRQLQGITSELEGIEPAHQRVLETIREVELIVTSPMFRTLQTTQQSLNFLLERPNPVPVIVDPRIQELGNHPCDTCSPLESIRKDFSSLTADWTLVENDAYYPSKLAPSPYEGTRAVSDARITSFLTWLRGRPEKVVIVVAHAGLLAAMTESHFMNTDYRIFNFTAAPVDAPADGRPIWETLVQWTQTTAQVRTVFTDREGGAMEADLSGGLKRSFAERAPRYADDFA
ncbi:hypothetical protein BT63DRAFT_213703 [Microthyrium microscopicum]|uniref:Phosphoglycerate mutase-like protein n=1 Tax=Microthyrium microscopicum TaxID=703497 RepID=A0A6A6UIF1_9PEZI|nr:hypothetical protein BT63DRAFT_213703 [Microthyrium microscopicum]